MELDQLYTLFNKCSSVSIDTRTIQAGALFFAIKGENFDGNKFASNALENGAKYAVVSDRSLKGEKYKYVPDTLIALQKLANFHRLKLSNTKFIALTGSNGKTTTKELLAHLLSQKFKVQYTKGNYNNHLGVPLTLLSIKEPTEIAVIEMGANHLNEIKELCQIAEPDLGFITNIGKAHIGEFGGQENIFKAKTELYDFLKAKKRTIFYNSDSFWLPKALENYPYKVSYQESLGLLNYNILGFKPKINCQIGEQNVTLDLGGKHNAQNLECALTVAFYFGLDPKHLIEGIKTFRAPANRSQWIKTSKNNVFLDAYNSNPNSMNASIEYFEELRDESKVIILGEMLELGEYATEEHSNLYKKLKNTNIPFYVIGASYAHIKESNVFSTLDTLISTIKLDQFTDRTVLLKGSRGMKMERLMDFL